MTYHIRVHCKEDDIYLRTTQTTLDENWIPTGHEGHELTDFVVEKEEA